MKRILFFALFVLPFVFYAQNYTNFFKDRYQIFIQKNYFQTVFLHIDKEYYTQNEKIWFKAYLLNTRLHQLDTSSKILYVELISPDKQIVSIKILRLNFGLAMGEFFIPDTFQTGYYQIRAYTNTMRNYPVVFYFTKNVFIETSNKRFSIHLWKRIKKTRRRAKRKKTKLKIYYQGTALVYNLSNTLILKFTDLNNQFIDIHGFVMNDKKQKLTKLRQIVKGIYKVSFTPKEKEKYFIVYFYRGKKFKYRLSEFERKGFVYSINDNNNKLIYNLKRIGFFTNDLNTQRIYLLAEQNGNIYYLNSFAIKDSILIKIDKTNLPYGVVNFYFFDYERNLLFTSHYYRSPKDTLSLQLFAKYSQDNDLLNLEIRCTRPNTFANLSLAIVSENVKSQNIVDYYYLNSQVPKFSFDTLNVNQINQILSVLWIDKYRWIRYLTDSQFVEYKYLKHLQISGYLANIFEGVPAMDAPVQLIILDKYNDVYKTKTDKKGRFRFFLDYQDTVNFIIEALNKNNKNTVIIFLDSYDTNEIVFNPIVDPYLRFYKVKNVFVNRTKQYKTSEGTLHKHVDQVIYADEIHSSGYTNILDLLKGRVAGYNQSNNFVHFRGYHSFNLSNEPLYLIDNVPVDASAVASINPDDVERIEIIRSATAIYGSRGANGVIAVYTQRGYNILWGKYKGQFIGYSTPQNFSFLETQNPYKTIFWHPWIQMINSQAFLQIKLHSQKSFKVILQGVSYDGKLLFVQKDFVLKK